MTQPEGRSEREALDVEQLIEALFNAEAPGDWPTWADYMGAFGSPGVPPWRRKAERLIAEYVKAAHPTPPDSIDDEEAGR